MSFNFMAAITICGDFGAPPQIKLVTVSPSICHEVMGLDAMILVSYTQLGSTCWSHLCYWWDQGRWVLSGEPRFIHELRGAWESEEQISGSVLLLKITVHHFVEQLFIFPLKLVMYTQDKEQTYLHMCGHTCCIQFKAPPQCRQGYSYQVSNWAFPVPNYWKQPSHSHAVWVWFPCGHLSAKAVGFSVLLHSDGLWHLPTLRTGCLLLAAPNGQSSVPEVAQCPSCGLATCIYSPDETQRPVLAQGSGTPSQAMFHFSLVFTPGVDCLGQRVLYLQGQV